MSHIRFVEKAPQAGAEHALRDGATIGRKGCDVALDDPNVSRRHAVVRREGGKVAIEDLGSTNGTLVNGSRIEGAAELHNGDVVRFGDVEWQLALPGDATRVVPTVTPKPAAAAPAFASPDQAFTRSAARRLEATVISYGVVLATAVAVAVYFAQR